MNVLRGVLFDNLGLKLVALLLAVLVYFNVYTDRPSSMLVSFPIQVTDLADSLSLSGSVPEAVQVELAGTGKQLIRLRLTEPPLRLSLAGVGIGRYERAIGAADLPLPEGAGLEVRRMVSPRTLELWVDRAVHRLVPVAARIEGSPAAGTVWSGSVGLRPAVVRVSGPEGVLAKLDSLRLEPAAIGGRRDTLRASLGARELPEWCVMAPERVEVVVPLEPEVVRRLVLPIEAPRGASDYRVAPERVTVTVSGPRSRLKSGSLGELRVRWRAPWPASDYVGRRIALRREGRLPAGVRVRFDPDSVTLRRAPAEARPAGD